MPTWFVTGASRGLGLEVARAALERGDAVVAAARTPQRVEEALGGPQAQLLAVSLDVTNHDRASEVIAEAVERFGGIDVLVNNAGRGFIGAVEEATSQEVQSMFDLNVFGLLAVTRAVLPIMRHQRSGRVLNISSVGGFSSRAGSGIYNATKFAVEGISEAMRLELAPFGITVTIVEPGGFRTDFHGPRSIEFAKTVIDDYAATVGARRNVAPTTSHPQPGDPRKAAEAMIQVAASDNPPLRLALGPDCVGRIEAKLAQVASDLDAWREISFATNFDEGSAS